MQLKNQWQCLAIGEKYRICGSSDPSSTRRITMTCTNGFQNCSLKTILFPFKMSRLLNGRAGSITYHIRNRPLFKNVHTIVKSPQGILFSFNRLTAGKIISKKSRGHCSELKILSLVGFGSFILKGTKWSMVWPCERRAIVRITKFPRLLPY